MLTSLPTLKRKAMKFLANKDEKMCVLHPFALKLKIILTYLSSLILHLKEPRVIDP